MSFPLHFLSMLSSISLFLLREKYKTPHCDHCDHPDASVEHIIIECPKYDEQRARLSDRLNSLDRRPLTISKVLEPWPHPDNQRRAVSALRDF